VPQPGHSPVPHHRLGRHFQYLGCFLDAEATKKAQLHNSACPLVDKCKFLQCVIQRDEIGIWLRGYQQRLIERNVGDRSASLLTMARAAKAVSMCRINCALMAKMGTVLLIDPPDASTSRI
jgi:hypothetical protein